LYNIAVISVQNALWHSCVIIAYLFLSRVLVFLNQCNEQLLMMFFCETYLDWNFYWCKIYILVLIHFYINIHCMLYTA